ncbi:MAG: Ycf48-like protein [Ignavibacteria bacterium]|nr:Ycf48-like protein [Ignavibacteria bacterium]
MRNIKIQIYILFIVIFLPVIGVNAQSSWFWLQPLPTGATLNSVDFWDRNTGYTCGKAGTVTKTTNGGLNWVLLGQITSLNLTDIECINLNTCIVVGDSGYIAKTTNGGLNWVVVPSGVPGILLDVDFPTANTGYISGASGKVLKSTNGGANWIAQNAGVSSTLFHVSFINPLKGAMAGINNIYTTTNGGNNWTIHHLGTFFDYFPSVQYLNDSTIYGLFLSFATTKVFISKNSGVSWDSFTVNRVISNDLSRAFRFKDETTGFIVTQYGDIYKTLNSGVNWFRDTSFTPENPDSDVFLDINTTEQNYFYAVGSGGVIVNTTNTGEHWQRQTGVQETYNDVFFIGENTGYTVGEKGILKKTTDAGYSWNRINLNTSLGIKKIVFTDLNTGYLCGDSGLVMKTNNGGMNWKNQNTPAGDTGFTSLNFIDSNQGFIGTNNGSIYKTTNSGINWVHNFTTSYGGGVFHDIDFYDETNGAVASDIAIYLTTNSGESWNSTLFPFSVLNSIEYIDTLIIISGGFNSESPLIIKSTNGGINWFNQSVSHIITSIQFLDNNYGMLCGYNGKISKTTNGGLNWILLPGTATERLNSIYFVNSNTGYSVGIAGQIIKTTNGGLSFINNNQTIKTDDYRLYQNYPNPFNPSTQIKYSLNKSSTVMIKVHDISGREVNTILNQYKQPGVYIETFNAINLSSGIYFYTLYTDGLQVSTKKFILLK